MGHAREAELKRGDAPKSRAHETTVFRELILRYAAEISPKHRGCDREVHELNKLSVDPIAELMLDDVKSPEIAAYRERRAREAAPATVNRELTILRPPTSTF